jgi:subtilase family serine protease
MKKTIFLRRLVCMLVIALFVIPVNVNIAGNQNDILDLSIEITGITPSQPQENNLIKIASTVSNIGTETVENITIQFNCDMDNNTIVFKNLKLLEPGKSASIEIDWMAIEGNHTIIAVVDPYNSIPDKNQKNNVGRLKITVEPGNEETSVTYGDNIKYEHLSNGITRATVPYPTVYNEKEDKWEPADFDLEWDNSMMQ